MNSCPQPTRRFEPNVLDFPIILESADEMCKQKVLCVADINKHTSIDICKQSVGIYSNFESFV